MSLSTLIAILIQSAISSPETADWSRGHIDPTALIRFRACVLTEDSPLSEEFDRLGMVHEPEGSWLIARRPDHSIAVLATPIDGNRTGLDWISGAWLPRNTSGAIDQMSRYGAYLTRLPQIAGYFGRDWAECALTERAVD